MGLKPWRVYLFVYKVYFVVWILAYGAFLWGSIVRPFGLSTLEAVIQTLLSGALYGFTFGKRLFSQRFWKISFIFCVSAEILMDYLGQKSGVSLSMELALFSFPCYIAAFLYAFKRHDMWGENASSR